MILRLVREQLRSQWRYTAWSAGLLAFALALATYAMVTGATAIAQDGSESVFGPREHHAVFESVVRPGPEVAALDSWDVTLLDFDKVQSLIAEASADVPVQAFVESFATARGSSEVSGTFVRVAAVATPIRWDRYLASGQAPGHGEVAIGDPLARGLGIGVGDTITFDPEWGMSPPGGITLVVSGVFKSGDVGPYWTQTPGDAVLSWSDAEALSIALPCGGCFSGISIPGMTALADTQVYWDGESGTLAPYETGDSAPWQPQGFSLDRAWETRDQAGYWSLIAALLAVLGMMIAAFGMGRAQAEARTKWTATARVLGATRRTIAFSSVIETSVVSLVGIALGLAAGIAAVAAHIALLRAGHPDALLPSGPNVPPLLILAEAGVGLAIAAVVALVPAFWAARVAPAAALKPVTPIGEAAVSRNVSVWWPVGIFAGAGLASSVLLWVHERGHHSDADAVGAALWISATVAAVAGAALVVELARSLVTWVGSALSRSRRPWLVAAGDGLVSHRRVFTFASLSALVLTAIFAWAATGAATRADPHWVYWTGEPPLPSFGTWWRDIFQASSHAATFGAVFAVAAIVAVAVTLASRSAFAADAATRTALGLGGAGERLAAAARQFAVMGAASIVGGLLGWAARLLARLAGAALALGDGVLSLDWNLTVAGHGLAATGLLVAVALAISLAGSLVVGLLARAGTPVETLRRTAGARS